MGYPDVVFNFLEGQNGYVHQKKEEGKVTSCSKGNFDYIYGKKAFKLHNKNE